MIWSGIRVKNLRRRMGWSRSDLARRLNCESRVVGLWEYDYSMPNHFFSQDLERLEVNAQTHSAYTQHQPLADQLLEYVDAEQIDSFSLEMSLVEEF